MAKRLPELRSVPADFYGEYVVPRRPVVLRGVASDWPAVRKWTPDYLKKVVGHRVIPMTRNEVSEIRIGEFLDAIANAGPNGGAKALPYMRNVFIHILLPELSADVRQPAWIQPNWLEVEPFASLIRAAWPEWVRWCELFVSAAGTRFPFVHVDTNMTHAWCVQVHGRKRYFAWTPSPDFAPVECRGKYLEILFDTEPYSAVVDPGDAVFVPAGWPHTADSVTTSISLSGSWMNDSNWLDFSRDFFETNLRRRLAR
jgi:hypothetical protein